MKMPFGQHAGKELCTLPLRYLDWLYAEYSPMINEVQRILRIEPLWRRIFFRDLEKVLARFHAGYPECEGVNEIVCEIRTLMKGSMP